MNLPDRINKTILHEIHFKVRSNILNTTDSMIDFTNADLTLNGESIKIDAKD